MKMKGFNSFTKKLNEQMNNPKTNNRTIGVTHLQISALVLPTMLLNLAVHLIQLIFIHRSHRGRVCLDLAYWSIKVQSSRSERRNGRSERDVTGLRAHWRCARARDGQWRDVIGWQGMTPIWPWWCWTIWRSTSTNLYIVREFILMHHLPVSFSY